MSERKLSYPILTNNGKIFPLWILKNFKKYKLEIITNKENTTTENVINSLKKYQKFIASYLDYKSPYKEILVYHGLGSGKTAATINIYNMLYNYNPLWNVFILIKAALKNDTWIKDIKKWLDKEDYENKYKNIKFIHYDSPRADKEFLDIVKNADIQKKNIYIIDEAHNFVKNVYNNIKNQKGKKAYTIYDYIQKEKMITDTTRIILLSGTPAVNYPFELALIFNLLRPGIFPMSEIQFNQLYVNTDQTGINIENKNIFQRRIMGLVSYYKGFTKESFALENIIIKNIEMSNLQQDIYEYFEFIEEKLAKRKTNSKIFKSYTRQSSNFVFPNISSLVNGEKRPRPSNFKITENEAEKVIQGKKLDSIDVNINLYMETINNFVSEFKKYLNNKNNLDIKNNNTIKNDLKIFKNKYNNNFDNFWKEYNNKSNLLIAMFNSSCKITSMLFYSLVSNGPILIYSNYVKMEGIEIIKLYFEFFDFSEFININNNNNTKFHYTEYHGNIEQSVRSKNLNEFNNIKNIDGSIIKIIFISAAGSEGLSLMNVRQVHILEPYWNETRIIQLIGRAIRYNSHINLPIEEQYVDVYRYFAVRNSKSKKDKITTDQEIYKLALNKQFLINSFLYYIKESAIDCGLFKNQNMTTEKYKCFSFNQSSYFDSYIGPAYKNDYYDDKKIDNGLNSINSEIKKIKVYKIKAVYSVDNKYSEPEYYWYDINTNVVYDLDLDFPVGKILSYNGISEKINNDTYILNNLIDIPTTNII